MKIIIFYASNSGSTYLTGQIIQEVLENADNEVILKHARHSVPQDLKDFEFVIFGSPSWKVEGKEGQPHEFMQEFLGKLSAGDLEGKNIGLDKISGLGYRSNDGIKINPPGIIRDLDSLPFPDLESFDMNKYPDFISLPSEAKRCLNWYSSRGCTFDCQFCFHQKNFRGQSAKRVFNDLKYMREKYNIDGFWFLDDNFMNSPKRVLEFCKLVKESGLDIKWGCEARVTSVKREIVSKMKEAGCVGIRNGLESGSDKILKVMHKGATLQDAKNAIEVLTEFDMPIKGAFIFGSPTETIEDAKETLNFIRWIYKTNPKADVWTVYFSPRPDTPWYDLAIQKGMKEIKLHEWADKYKHKQLYEFNMSELNEKQVKKIFQKVKIYKFLSLSRQKNYLNVPSSIIRYTIKNIDSFIKSFFVNREFKPIFNN